VRIPVIASGGAGKLADFATAFQETGVTAALAASLFHFGELTIPQVKADCRSKGIPMR
jgi:cyclase